MSKAAIDQTVFVDVAKAELKAEEAIKNLIQVELEYFPTGTNPISDRRVERFRKALNLI